MIDVVHPLETSVSSEEVDDEVAFKVLNHDNLPISIIGETIFKPFGLGNQKQKPNGIVYPTRRILTSLEENKHFSKSIGHIHNSEEITDHNDSNKKLSNSHGNLNHTNSATKFHPEDLNNDFETKFTKSLDAKLRKLQKHEKQIKKTTYNEKKPFVTTVRKGTFLEAPTLITTNCNKATEFVPASDGNSTKKLYAYSSEPRVLSRTPAKQVHRSRCEAAAIAAAHLVGSVAGIEHNEAYAKDRIYHNVSTIPMPYANLMFERRIVRGTNFAPRIETHQGDGESAAARAAQARRRAIARKKARNQTVRAAQLRLGSPPAIKGRKHEPVQTDQYLEEIFITPPVVDMCTQTELFLDRPVSPFYIPAKTGEDAETQIYPGDLFDFDMEVQPILEVLVGKTIEQALVEVLEEEELASLREQQRKFLEVRAAEACETQRIIEREIRLQKEKERRMKDYAEGITIQKEMEERIAASVLMQGYLADLLPSVLDGLESEGVLLDNIKEDIDHSFMPWLMKEVTTELEEIVSSRDVLSDIVREILENRADIYHAIYTMKVEAEVCEEEMDGTPFDSRAIRNLVYGVDQPNIDDKTKEIVSDKKE